MEEEELQGLFEDGMEREMMREVECPYADGTMEISKRNFHLCQVSLMPQDVAQG